MFQSTRPRGARRRWRSSVPGLQVSIHAPAWGATLVRLSVDSRRMFQSTRPRGARRVAGRRESLSRRLVCFNPRARVGRDVEVDAAMPYRGVSIHAPAWGATAADAPVQSGCTFQSTRPRGARRASASTRSAGAVSIHAPAWGATRTGVRHQRSSRFNPRARVGRDEADS